MIAIVFIKGAKFCNKITFENYECEFLLYVYRFCTKSQFNIYETINFFQNLII